MTTPTTPAPRAAINPEHLLRALESMLAFTSEESREDQKTSPRLREEFRAVRERAEALAEDARAHFTARKRAGA